ncbi:Ribosomal RNA small subunit methyltransferase E [Methylophaga frappieri]|uniref:Ribosomal RNA small subunit methyltransferase E n=1 Tax=Methylophaga frappieri (strain ATCC BAA-2434 / DSM 25690 / JAM7) TaxID=754477 RepID=I1YKF3_METFJ|nr:Ribosomal RNA small subunit methyltransferase E [Methylophaga frappieri]
MRFYYPGPYLWDAEFELPAAICRHAVQVLRLKAGSEIHLFDGVGNEYLAVLTSVDKRSSWARLERQLAVQNESPLAVTLLQGISRGERMDYAIQKAVELGVSDIVPVVTERCNVSLSAERAEKRHLHWQGVMVAACEQSGRAVLPVLQSVQPLEEAIHTTKGTCRLVLDPQSGQSMQALAKPEAVTLLIGPEGGLSDREVAQAVEAGFTPIQFGPRVLRTETASAAALAVVQALWGDLA